MRHLILSLAILVLLAPSAMAAVINVPADELTIADALLAAVDGDQIIIANGIYPINSTLVVDKELTLTGESEAGVTLQINTGASWGMHLRADNITLEFLTLDIISTTPTGGFPIHASGTTNLPGGYTDLTLRHLTVQGDATTTLERRTGVDVHGYDTVTLLDIDSSDASFGNGVQVTGCLNVTMDDITTANNAWGSIAIYASKPAYLNRGSDNVVIDGATMFVGENNIFSQDEFGLFNTNLSVTGWDHLVFNDFAVGYTFFQNTEADAIVASLANPGTETGSSIERLSDGHWIVGAGMTIQTAIDDAPAAGTVEVRAGTFVEQLEIAKDLSLEGAGTGVTTVEAFASMPLFYTTSLDNFPVVYVHDADAVVVRDLTVDGLGQGNTNHRFMGISYHQAGGGVYDCEIKDVRHTPLNGAQGGNAFYLYNDDAVARSMDVWNCIVYGFQKNGITLNSLNTPLVVSVQGNSVTGAIGLTADNGDPAQNGIQLWGDQITGVVDGNDIHSIAYDNTFNSGAWVATTILDFYSQADITNNVLDQGHVGIYKIDGQGLIADNDITIEKIGIFAWGIVGSDPPRIHTSPFDVDVDASKAERASKAALLGVVIDGNTVTFLGPDNTATYGIEGDAGYGPDDIDLTVTNNTVTGFEAGVDIFQCTSNCDTGVFTNVVVNNNSFSGNTFGVRSNVTYLTVDATCNWWGDISGPFHPVDNLLGTGGEVQGDIIWSPWLDDDITGAPACVMTPNSIVAANPGPGAEITPCDPCLTVPIEIARVNTTEARGMSVTFELSPELSFCAGYAADIIPTYGAGSWLGAIPSGDVQDFILDNGDGTYTVDRSILGAACGSALSGSVFTVNVAYTGAIPSDATGSITVLSVTLRDCANAPLSAVPGAPGNINIDYAPPSAIVNLAAVQQKTGNGTNGTTNIQLSWDAVTDPDVTGISLYRKDFGFYPEYDDGGGSVPSAPTDPADAVANGWAPAASLAPGATSYPDEPALRDFWYYIAFTDDGCLDGAGSNRTDGNLNYHLGDVSDGVTPGDGDNAVDGLDISGLGAGYGTIDTDPDYRNWLDVGPTTDFSVDALPTTDNAVQFEDLMMFAINYSLVSKDVHAPRPAAFNDITLKVLESNESRVSVEIHMDGDGTLQGIHVPLRWNAQTLRPVGMSEGSLMSSQGRQVFVASARAGEVDAAVFGTDGVGISGSGLLAVLHFEVIGDGDYGIVPGEIVARDSENLEQPISGNVTGGVPSGRLPAESVLHPNYPNPFNPKTTISFTLAQAGAVRLNIYSLDGRLVTTLVEESMTAGPHQMQWTGLDENGRGVSSGTYLVRLVAPDMVQSQRITLIK